MIKRPKSGNICRLRVRVKIDIMWLSRMSMKWLIGIVIPLNWINWIAWINKKFNSNKLNKQLRVVQTYWTWKIISSKSNFTILNNKSPSNKTLSINFNSKTNPTIATLTTRDQSPHSTISINKVPQQSTRTHHSTLTKSQSEKYPKSKFIKF